MTGTTARRSISLAVVLALSVGLGALGASPAQTAEAISPTLARPNDPPNIVLVLSDDQPKGTLAAMPAVSSRIRDKGVLFRNAVIPTSLCCPSRAALLSGNLAHTTGVYSNDQDNYGGWSAFHDDEDQTLATELSAAGYQTGLFGKYFNGFQGVAPGGYVPPGWDAFRVLQKDDGGDAGYYNYSLTGLPNHYGSTPEDYSTDVLRDLAVDFIESAPSDQPLFVELSVFGPHDPYKPAPRHAGAWAHRAFVPPAGMNERDMSDKPSWLKDAPRVKRALMAKQWQRRMETLMSVDEAVQALVRALGDRMSNTLFIYLSDNGLMQGIHRLARKSVPYRAATSVPLVMRWDGVIEPGSASNRITPNIDVTATIAEAAGVSWPMEGRSALSTGRRGVVLEAVTRIAAEPHPAYCGWRSRGYLYVRYSGGEERELYDYAVDPHELDNVAGKPKYRDIETKLERKTKRHCRSVPPGFTWS